MAKKYTCPPQKATADNTFSDNLVGFQVVNGGGLTQGNFEFTTSITEKSNREFIIGTFSDPITLDTLGINSVEESKAIVEKNFKVYPNFDLSNVTTFSQYGSLVKRMSVSITKIINYFPAALEISFYGANYTTASTATNISYNSQNNETYFELDAANIQNPFNIDFTINSARNLKLSEIEVSPIRDMVTNLSKYSLYLNDQNYNLVFMTPTTSLTTGVLKITVKGNPFSGQSSTNEYLVIRPNPMKTEEIFNQDFDEVEKFLLNRKTNPQYTAEFTVVKEADDGTAYLTKQSITWPFYGVWNLDIITVRFTDYLTKLNDISASFDEFKTRLIVRFLTTGAFKDFDTDDQKITKLLEIYGRSFDQVKKFIEALAYMNSVNYTIQNDIPSQLLKNLSQTLGWTQNISPITNEGLLDTLFNNNTPSQFPGQPISSTPDELSYQYYRNLILNSAYLFKSKGTRSSIQNLLRLIGAPDALVDFNEHIYIADQRINMNQFNDEFSFISGGTFATELPVLEPGNTFKIFGRQFTGFTIQTITEDVSLGRDDFPVDDQGYPKAPEDTDDFFFQMGAGWFEQTPQHRANEIFDATLSTFTGQNPNVQTYLEGFTYGQKYLDRFRDFPYTDLGFSLTRIPDNKKSWVDTQTGLRRNSDNNNAFYFVDDEKLVLNVKNVDLYLNPGQALTYDVWFLSSNYNYPIPSTGYTRNGNCYCPTYLNPIILDKTLIDPNPLDKTFFEFAQTFWQNMINVRDRQFITNGKTGGYPTLESIYWRYLRANDIPNIPNANYSYQNMIDYVQGLGDYWIRLVEQMVPATTIWLGGVRYENSAFHRQKFVWRRQRGCQLVPVPCSPCTLSGLILPNDCPVAFTTCEIYPWGSASPLVTNFGELLNQIVTNYTQDPNCDTNTIVSQWYVNVSLGSNTIINYKFFDGAGITIPSISFPTPDQWKNALLSQLTSLINYGLYYSVSGDKITVFTVTCDGLNLDSEFKINVGINFTINCITASSVLD
jgi:hypothetical protein